MSGWKIERKLPNLRKMKKTKKCQPAARDTPNLIKIEGVPDRGLARPPKKLTERKNKKLKSNCYMSHDAVDYLILSLHKQF